MHSGEEVGRCGAPDPISRADGGLVGPVAVETVRRFKFDIAVIGCSALDTDGDILDFDIEEVGVSQAILDRARRRLLVADHWKFQRSAPARIASLAAMDAIVTDRPLPAPLAARCRDWGTGVILGH